MTNTSAKSLKEVWASITQKPCPDSFLTPDELAQRLKVEKSWVFEQTRQRAKVRNKTPMPCFRIGKYLRFSWPDVYEWMEQNGSGR